MTQTKKEKDNRAEQQARSGVEHIVDLMRWFNHAQDCDGDCEETTVPYPVTEYCSTDATIEELREKYHDEEAAQTAIDESHYGIEVRGGWATPGDKETLADPVEYTITLSGGGPATRIHGELGPHNIPDTAEMQYQDWFTPWETLYIEDDKQRELLEEYAERFYYGY